MGQILHGSATTTETIRRAIQNSQASLRELAVRHGLPVPSLRQSWNVLSVSPVVGCCVGPCARTSGVSYFKA